MNEAWKGRRFKTEKYQEFIDNACLLMPAQKIIEFEKLHLSIVFGFSNKNSDVDNPIKTLLDTIKEKYEIDDRYIYRLDVEKQIVIQKQREVDELLQKVQKAIDDAKNSTKKGGLTLPSWFKLMKG